jgi:hypothetical protein
MSSLTTNSPNRITTAHRAQIVAEAVVSAYIHELAATQRTRERDRDRAPNRQRCPESPTRALTRSPLAPRVRDHALAPRRRAALELGT